VLGIRSCYIILCPLNAVDELARCRNRHVPCRTRNGQRNMGPRVSEDLSQILPVGFSFFFQTSMDILVIPASRDFGALRGLCIHELKLVRP
jgi:hypothetical protein